MKLPRPSVSPLRTSWQSLSRSRNGYVLGFERARGRCIHWHVDYAKRVPRDAEWTCGESGIASRNAGEVDCPKCLELIRERGGAER